jgi:hypothetical protein
VLATATSISNTGSVWMVAAKGLAEPWRGSASLGLDHGQRVAVRIQDQ